MGRSIQLFVLVAVLWLTYVASGSALAAPLRPIEVKADGGATLEVGCENVMVTATSGSVSPSVAPCSGAPSITVTGTTVEQADHHHDLSSDAHDYASPTAVNVVISSDFAVDGPVVIDGAMVIINGSITASSITITGTDGVKLKESASLVATSGPIVIDGTDVGVIVDPGVTVHAGGGSIVVSGRNIVVNGIIESVGGSISTISADNGFTWVAGNIDTSDASVAGVGGPIVVTRGAVVIDSTASIDSSGTNGGGTIYIGGGPRGEGDIPNAKSVIVNTDAVINADATVNGDGGNVVVWADDLTAYDGAITTRGGNESGHGGDVEISSKISLEQKGTIDATAARGDDGAILIDPLYYMVLPNFNVFGTEIDDLDHMLIKSGLVVDTGQFIFDYFSSLFTGEDLTSGISPGSLNVRYGSTNSVIGLLGLAAKVPPFKKPLKPYKPIITALKFRALVSMVRTATLEAYTGDVSVQSIFGIGMFHGLLDPAGTDDGLNFSNQGPGDEINFTTMFSVQSHGDISVGGGDIILHAGAPFDVDVVEDLIIGMVPAGTAMASALDLDDFLHDIDIASLVRVSLLNSLTSDSTGQNLVGFVNLTCEGCIPAVVGLSVDVYADPAGNFEYIDDILIALGAVVPGWFADTTAAIDDVFDALPGTNAGDALDIALGGYVIPGIPGSVLTLCLNDLGVFGIIVGTDCWTVVPVPGETTDFPATCNLIETTGGADSCWTTDPIPATYETHSHTEWRNHYCSNGLGGSVWVSTGGHDTCVVGGHSHGGWNTSHWCDIWSVPSNHGGCAQLTPAIPGVPGVYVAAFSSCNLGLGFWVGGECYTTPPVPGEWVTDCYSIPPIPGFTVEGECYSTPPLPVPGICDLDPAIPCSAAELAEITFAPLLMDAIEATVSFSTGIDFSALNSMGGAFPDSVGMPAFSLVNEVPTIVYVENIDNPDGGIDLINTGTGDVLIAKTVAGNSVVIESRASVKNHQFESSSWDFSEWDSTKNPAGPGSAVIVTGDLKITADGTVGEASAPLGIKQVGGDIKVDIDNAGNGGVYLHGKDSLTLAATSTITSTSDDVFALKISSVHNLTIPAGVSLTADADPSDSDAGGIDLEVDSGDSDDAGGTLFYRGSASGWNLNMWGEEDSDTFDLDSNASDGIPVNIFGGLSDDTLNFDPAGRAVTHGTTPQLLVSGRSPITLFSVERVNGVAPNLDPIGGQVVDEGNELQIPYSFTDWGADEWNVTLTDVSTGTQLAQAPITGTPNGLGPFPMSQSFSYVFADDQEVDLRLCATDLGDGGTTCEDFHVSIGNADPTADAGPGQTALEGDTVALGPATFNDPGTLDTHTATIDWDDSTVLDTGVVIQSPFGPPGSTGGQDGTVSGTHVYADNGIYTVTLTVADDDGAVTSDTVLITVDNAPPAVDAGDDATAIEGDVFSLAPVTFTDPGSLDSHTATIDWGDGTPVQSGLVTETPSGPPGIPGGQSGTVGGSHIYADDGTYTVTVTVTDDDTASHFDTLYVTVTNVPPTITPSGEPEVIVFSPFEIDSSFSDPGFDCFSCLSAEDFTATIDWGDGAVEPASVTEVPGGPGALSSGSVTGSHIYTWVGTYPVTVTVTDDDGGTASFVHDVEVLGGRELIVQAMRGLEPFSSESRDIQKALDELEDVIDWELWDDEIHLESRHGHRVFSDQKKAVGTLLNALGRSSISPEAAEAAFEAIRLILISDQVIAELAIADAESTPVLSPSRQSSVDRELASAREELVEAQADVDRGRFTHAIDHYRGAWEHALKAQKAAMAPAGISSTTDAGALDDDKGKKK